MKNRFFIFALIIAFLTAALVLLAGCAMGDFNRYNCRYCGEKVTNATQADMHGVSYTASGNKFIAKCVIAAPCGVKDHYVLREGTNKGKDKNGVDHSLKCTLCGGYLCTGTHGLGKCYKNYDGTRSIPSAEVKSSDATLKGLSASLSTNGGAAAPAAFAEAFSAGRYSYTFEGAFHEGDEIQIAAEANHQKATVTGTGSHKLALGENTIKVTVTAENSISIKTYTVTVNAVAPLSDDWTLKTFRLTLPNGTKIDMKDPDARKNISVQDITRATVTAVPNDAKAKAAGDQGTITIDEGTNEYRVRVTAENGNTATFIYKITMTVSPAPAPTPTPTLSSDAALESLTLEVPDAGSWSLAPGFSPDVYEYSAECGEPSVTVRGVAHHSGATVEGNGTFTLAPGENTLRIIVTAEDGATAKVYRIVVFRS